MLVVVLLFLLFLLFLVSSSDVDSSHFVGTSFFIVFFTKV